LIIPPFSYLIPFAVLILSDINYFAWLFVYIQQHDAVLYINKALKEGTQISSFRKEALGRDRTGTSYWYFFLIKYDPIFKIPKTLKLSLLMCLFLS